MMFPEIQLISVCRVVSASGSPLAPWAFSTNPRENGLRYTDANNRLRQLTVEGLC
jgi:hypothetical protein